MATTYAESYVEKYVEFFGHSIEENQFFYDESGEKMIKYVLVWSRMGFVLNEGQIEGRSVKTTRI